eukprot:NODE_712_length_2426_cov_69.647851_g537_i1.p1 GENE.NODE_712_length_2426_cov_69.647851_g537_i1~~NODE_712_length_2426_cov_69.647851_g537_i1.p1  ORF type:complete len:774 (-),score=184.75 NODE_712_length_2426_cov_69.647851_g537_i1:103-2166(-)
MVDNDRYTRFLQRYGFDLTVDTACFVRDYHIVLAKECLHQMINLINSELPKSFTNSSKNEDTKLSSIKSIAPEKDEVITQEQLYPEKECEENIGNILTENSVAENIEPNHITSPNTPEEIGPDNDTPTQVDPSHALIVNEDLVPHDDNNENNESTQENRNEDNNSQPHDLEIETTQVGNEIENDNQENEHHENDNDHHDEGSESGMVGEDGSVVAGGSDVGGHGEELGGDTQELDANHQERRKQMLEICDALSKEDDLHTFEDDPSEIPSYLEYIKRPIWMEKVRARTQDRKYGWKAFKKDLESIYNNAMKFNDSTTTYYQKAKHLRSLSIKLVNPHIPHSRSKPSPDPLCYKAIRPKLKHKGSGTPKLSPASQPGSMDPPSPLALPKQHRRHLPRFPLSTPMATRATDRPNDFVPPIKKPKVEEHKPALKINTNTISSAIRSLNTNEVDPIVSPISPLSPLSPFVASPLKPSPDYQLLQQQLKKLSNFYYSCIPHLEQDRWTFDTIQGVNDRLFRLNQLQKVRHSIQTISCCYQLSQFHKQIRTSLELHRRSSTIARQVQRRFKKWKEGKRDALTQNVDLVDVYEVKHLGTTPNHGGVLYYRAIPIELLATTLREGLLSLDLDDQHGKLYLNPLAAALYCLLDKTEPDGVIAEIEVDIDDKDEPNTSLVLKNQNHRINYLLHVRSI